MNDLQLVDYMDGYRFQIKCKVCDYEWYEEPIEVMGLAITHPRMYLEEVEEILFCRSCKCSHTKITPIITTRRHHFVGGLA